MRKYEKSCLKKLKSIYKLGYIPNRRNESYKYVSSCEKVEVGTLINCFGHACFNLTNKHLEEQQFTKKESQIFWEFPAGFIKSNDILYMKSVVTAAGLKIAKCSYNANPKENQWKVALYFNDVKKDVHFMLQEKSCLWSSKLGTARNISYFKGLTPPKTYKSYKLHSYYLITNPYYKTNNPSKNEKTI